jgi:predicted HAD superfamily Cof-like phosphohydrolase
MQNPATTISIEGENFHVSWNVPTAEVDKIHADIVEQNRMSEYHKVRQFTEESLGKPCPKTPQLMDKSAVKFIVQMVISEMTELAQTVCTDAEETKSFIRECLFKDFNENYQRPDNETDLIAEQADALVDARYYMLNCSAKHGIDSSRVFNVVHAANMAKKWEDGQFHRREDGKVIKPPNWAEPDIRKEIKRQMDISP